MSVESQIFVLRWTTYGPETLTASRHFVIGHEGTIINVWKG